MKSTKNSISVKIFYPNRIIEKRVCSNRSIGNKRKKADTFEDNCDEKTASVAKDTSSNLVDIAVKIEKFFRI